jgi:hypothetical protein
VADGEVEAAVSCREMIGASADPGGPEDPRPAAVTFVTTEHFTLQGARASARSPAG